MDGGGEINTKIFAAQAAPSTPAQKFREQLDQLQDVPKHAAALGRLAKAIESTYTPATHNAIDIICTKFAKPLSTIIGSHHPDYEDQFLKLFSAATRFIDEDVFTIVRNIEVFASDAFKQAAQAVGRINPEVPMVDISLGVVGLGLSLPGLITEINQQKDARNLLDWSSVQTKMDTAARERWFTAINEAENKQRAELEESSESCSEEQQFNQEQEEEKKQKRAQRFIAFLFAYIRLAEANQQLFADKYDIAMDVKTLALRLVKKVASETSQHDESETNISAEIEVESQDYSVEQNNQSSKSFSLANLLARLRNSKIGKAIVTLTQGFAIYAMMYWLLSYPLELAQKFGVLHVADPFLLPVLCFAIPLIVALAYLGFKWISNSNEENTEEQRATRIALDYAYYKEHIENAKERFSIMQAEIRASNERVAQTDDQENTLLQGKNNQSNFQTLHVALETDLTKFKGIIKIKSAQDYANDSAVTSRTEQVKKFLDKISGKGKFTSEAERAMRGAIIGGIAAFVLGLTFAWIILDAFSVVAKITEFGIRSPKFAVPPDTFSPFATLPEASIVIAAVLMVITIVAIVYSILNGYYENKEKFALQQQKLKEFNNNELAINNLTSQLTALAKEIAQKELLLNDLKEQLSQLSLKLTDEQKNKLQPGDIENLIAKTTAADLPKFDGRYGSFLGQKLHSDNYFLRQEDDTDSAGDNAKIGLSKFFNNARGFIEGMGSGSLMVRTTLFVFMALLPTIIPYNILDNPINLLIVGCVALAVGFIVGAIKAYRDHANAQQELEQRFVDELPLRYQYLLEENNYLDAQIECVHRGIHEISQKLDNTSQVAILEPPLDLTAHRPLFTRGVFQQPMHQPALQPQPAAMDVATASLEG